MDKLRYRLRCQIFAHSSDVRTLCVMDNAIISGSRDMSVKLWTENRGLYENSATLNAHTNYISSVCVLPQSQNFPVGLIVSGGHDHKIFGFIPYTEDPILCLEGHSGPVCCLVHSTIKDCLLSSSWDCSAKMWNVSKQQCLFTLYGHSQTIWAVIHIPFNFIVTGSADKMIKVFNSDGDFINTLAGHTDCVRSLSYLHETIIVSCSNDGTVRTWNVRDGNCISVQQVHSNYIYSIKAVYDQNLMTVGCEDKILSVITGCNQQSVVLPAQSVWAVAILPNCDIVTGSSDGYIRIFTTSSSRQASSEELKTFENQLPESLQAVAKTSTPFQSEKIFRKVHDKGEFDGQLKFIKVLGTIKCFKWSANNKKWCPVTDMTTSQPESESNINMYEGKVYDYIFNIDVEGEYTSLLKLPYNIAEDPLMVAENFIRKHNLNPNLTVIIVNYLNKVTQSNTEVMDIQEPKMQRVYFPPENFIMFQKFEEKILKQRLNDFWKNQQLDLGDPSLEYLKSLTLPDEVLTDDYIRYGITEMIKCIDIWPESIIYPVLDIARISLLRSKISTIMFTEGYATQLWNHIVKYMQEDSNFSNKMFICRMLCNMFQTEEGIDFIFDRKEILFSRIPMSSFIEKHRGYEIALASLLVNLSMAAIKRKDTIAISVSLDILQGIVKLMKEEEALFRVLVALGTLSTTVGNAVYTQDIYKILKDVSTWKNRKDDGSIKASQVAKQLITNYVSLTLENHPETGDVLVDRRGAC